MSLSDFYQESESESVSLESLVSKEVLTVAEGDESQIVSASRVGRQTNDPN